MSVRGRGRGRGRPRGGGVRKTTIWEWETYTPGPEVYNRLFHMHKAPPILEPHLSNDCPIPNARSRILRRNQTDDEFNRNYYTVQITYLPTARQASSMSEEDVDTKDGVERTVTEEVDMSRILRYVSHREFERFENAEFRAEAEAEAAAERAERQELAKRRLKKNARVPGMGRGSPMLTGLGLDTESMRRPRGRPRGGRNKGRGRPAGRGRGRLVSSGLAVTMGDAEAEGLVDMEPLEDSPLEQDGAERMIAETEDEEEDSEEEELRVGKQMSPDVARSSFVANSALPISPAAPRRTSTLIPAIWHGRPDLMHVDDLEEDEDEDVEDAEDASSAAAQLRFESRERAMLDLDEESLEDDRHRSKRARTGSTSSHHRIPASKIYKPGSALQGLAAAPSPTNRHPISLPSETESSSDSDDAIPARPSSPIRAVESMDTCELVSRPNGDRQLDEPDEADEENGAEEYVVEVILDHLYEGATKYYLVKWEGYVDSSDWLPEDDLAGASELVAEYNEKVRREKGKVRIE